MGEIKIKMETVENNKKMALLIGKRIGNPSNLYEVIRWKDREDFDYNTTYNHLELKFDSNWNWLMEIIDEIKSLGIEEYELLDNIDDALICVNFSATYKACVECIDWYNKHNTD